MGTSRSISSLVVGAVFSAFGPACRSNDIQIVDLHSDFRDIWAGREVAETGKQADPNVPVVVDFSTTVSGGYQPFMDSRPRIWRQVPSF